MVKDYSEEGDAHSHKEMSRDRQWVLKKFGVCKLSNNDCFISPAQVSSLPSHPAVSDGSHGNHTPECGCHHHLSVVGHVNVYSGLALR